jgi:ribosomal-protein-alanine N-acetyltransferase
MTHAGWSRAPYAFHKMDEAAAGAIAEWRYPGEYGFYDLSADPDDLGEMLDRSRWEEEYFRVDRDGCLAGFWQIKPARGEVTEIGLGLAPELTGRGLGTAFVLAGVDLTVASTRTAVVALDVAEFNRRARTVYERVGFRAVRTLVRETPQGPLSFIAMELRVPRSPPLA